MLPSMWTTLPLVIALACSGGDDVTTQYLGQLRPLLQENGLLAERVLLQAAKVYNEEAKPDQVADVWIEEIVPLAEHLQNQATLVVPPPPYASSHAEIVAIWGDRALAYRNLGEAIQSGSTNDWNAATTLTSDVKLREEKWFDTLNTALAPSGSSVDPYP
jgi:hypothetical protein